MSPIRAGLSVLQCEHGVLQCKHSVLPCVAVCCSVLQCATRLLCGGLIFRTLQRENVDTYVVYAHTHTNPPHLPPSNPPTHLRCHSWEEHEEHLEVDHVIIYTCKYTCKYTNIYND